MNTPIHNFLEEYCNKKVIRLHMPSHKGILNPHDITEIYGADSLYESNGIISQSEENASRIYGTKATYYSTAGSTLAIQSMVYIIKKDHRKMYAIRNVHRSFLNACVLLDIPVTWIYPNYENTIISGSIDLSYLEDTLSKDNSRKSLYITSPDYYGIVADVQSIANICHKYDTILLVDNAHGTILNFLENNYHPIHLGADMCADSPHKTLPVLTGGGYLHINHDEYVSLGKSAMSAFGSTSPSYLIMESLDLCNHYIEKQLPIDLPKVIKNIESIRQDYSNKFTFSDSREPLHLTFLLWKDGFSGIELSRRLRDYNIECEYSDARSLVLLFSPVDDDSVFIRLRYALDHISLDRISFNDKPLILHPLNQTMSMHDATFSPSESIHITDAVGRICAEIKVPCPPAIPIAVSGEIISDECIEIFKTYGLNEIIVVK